MFCLDVQRQLDDYLDGQLADNERTAIDAHLVSCVDCRQRVGQAQNVLLTLQSMMPIPPRPGYAERILGSLPRPAAQDRPRRSAALWFSTGFATALATLAGLWLVLAQPARQAQQNVAVVALHVIPRQVHKVDLLFNSPGHIRQATLRIELPPGVDIKGYAKRRVLEWQTELKPGATRLTLPIVLEGAHSGGIITATLRQADKRRVFQLRIIPDGVSSQRIFSNQPV
jgi:hypothetical protein